METGGEQILAASFMRRPVQRKYATNVVTQVARRVGERSISYSIITRASIEKWIALAFLRVLG